MFSFPNQQLAKQAGAWLGRDTTWHEKGWLSQLDPSLPTHRLPISLPPLDHTGRQQHAHQIPDDLLALWARQPASLR